MISAGDFNTIMNPNLDTTNRKRKVTGIKKGIMRKIQDLGLLDIWRDFHKNS